MRLLLEVAAGLEVGVRPSAARDQAFDRLQEQGHDGAPRRRDREGDQDVEHRTGGVEDLFELLDARFRGFRKERLAVAQLREIDGADVPVDVFVRELGEFEVLYS